MKDRIRTLRLARGMTLQQVASHFDISAASVSSWEKGGSIPDGRKLARLADVLGTSIQYLVDGEAQPNPQAVGHTGQSVPFISWEQLGTGRGPTNLCQKVQALHTVPSVQAFATRYPGGATGVDWQPGRLPAGALVVIEPALTPQPTDLALLLDRTGKPFIGSPISGSLGDLDGLRYSDYSSGANHSSCRLLGRIIEWRISSII